MKVYDYNTIKKIFIHEIIKHSIDDFITIYTAIGTRLFWMNGYVFTFSGFSETDDIVRARLQGDYHIKIFEYAEMKEYKEKIKKDFEVIVFKVNSDLFKTITDFIKNDFEKNK